jgi:hypothetical protein
VSVPAHVHVPAEQAPPGPHECPHAPQFSAVLIGSMHPPPQSILPPAQTHVPAAQVCPGWHACPQAPQCRLFVCVSTQPPKHIVVLVPHVQAPPVHVPPAPHERPHTPQLAASVCRSVHVLPHAVCPFRHWQRPIKQSKPVEQRVAQLPQNIGSVCVYTQLYIPADMQYCRGESHGSRHWPPMHVWPEAHAVPQCPQLVVSVRASTHAPLHTTLGAGHEHVPRRQPTPTGQRLVHAPQLDGSDCVSMQALPQRS